MLQTLQNLALARLWSLGSARIRRSKTSHLPDCGLWALRDCGRSCAGCGLVWALRDCGRSCAGCGLGALARRSSQPLDSGRFRRAKTSHLLDCGLWALRESDAPKPRACQTVGSGLCETVGGVAQAVGSGLWRAKSFFSSGPKLPFKPLKPLKRSDTCQWLCHTSGFWTLQTLHGCFRRSKTSHLLDCGLWALRESDAPKPRTCQTVGSGLCETVGGVAQAVGSGLWRAKSFFSSGPKLPFKPLKPLKRSDTCQWLCHTSGFWTLQTLHGCFRRSKTSHLLDCGLWALRESDAPKPRTCQTVGSGLCETVGGVAQAVGSSGLCETVGGVAQAVGSGRWRAGAASLWILDASDAPKPRTCQTVGSGLCETVGGVAQAVGSGLWRAKSFFSSGPKLPFKRLKPLKPRKPVKPLKPLKRSDTCQWLCHTSGFWTLQTLHGCFRRSKTSHLLDCGLWALRESDAPKPRTCQTVGSGLCETVGGVAQAVGSGLWRAKSFFSSGPKLPFKCLKPLKPLKPLKRSDTCQWLCHTSGFWTLQTLHGCFRRSKTSHLLCGLWALRESDAPKPRTCQTVGSALCEPVGGVAQIVDSGLWRATYFWSCAGCGLGALARRSSQPLDSGRFRRSKTSHLPDCGRSCAGCGLGALARQILFF